MQRRPTPLWLPYLVAMLAVIAGSLVGPVLSPSGDSRVLVLVFFAVVIFSGWYGGFGPAVLATIASYLAANLLFLPTKSRFVVDYGSVTFILVCLAVAAFSEAMRQARRQSPARLRRSIPRTRSRRRRRQARSRSAVSRRACTTRAMSSRVR